MPFEDLSKIEQDVVCQFLKATAEGSFFPEWEFHTLFGLTHQEVKQIVKKWAVIDKDSSLVVLAINNSLNNLLYYPHSLVILYSFKKTKTKNNAVPLVKSPQVSQVNNSPSALTS